MEKIVVYIQQVSLLFVIDVAISKKSMLSTFILYFSGADPFMTEPDLVFMGDRCVIDRASIVCHLNTRGNFELAKIVIEKDCTLRNGSRVQQACHMEEGSQLLEKGLAMTGEIIEAYSVWQGGPASWWFQYDMQKLATLACNSYVVKDADEGIYIEMNKHTPLLSDMPLSPLWESHAIV